ncbi:MAG: amidohydrolase family protein [Myxococcales bacterium]|nr:amidohydrolase family protein [Myxococcales bacterium]
MVCMQPSSRFLAAVILAVLALTVAPAPGIGAEPAKPSAAAPQIQADFVLQSAAVYTVDRARTWAEAVAIRGDEIVYVGGNPGAARYVGPKTRVLNLAGKMVLPGFQDAHVHPLWAGVERLDCKLYDLPTREAYARAVAEYAASHPKEPWIKGAGWDMGFFPGGLPTRQELDAVVSDRPVFLASKDGHSGWVNSKALEVAGITRETPDPPRGRIDRDKNGEPSGSLQESAIELVQKLAPRPTPEEARDGLKFAMRKLNAFGITSVQEASVPLGDAQGYRMLEVYRDVDRSGALTARVVASLTWDPEKGDEQIQDFVRARREYTQGRLRAHAVKIFQDGVIEAKTAALLEPYRGTQGDTGIALIEPETLKRIVTRLDKEGFQLHFHAIGDAAIRQVFDALEAARRTNGARDSRHHLSHIELFHPDDIPRFRELGAVANFQPLWALADGYIRKLTLPILPPETHRWIYPIASVLRSGGIVAFGSDWSVSSANPLEEMEVAVRRADWTDPDAAPFLPEERIDLRDAIAAFTINAAYVSFQDDRTGSIEPGKLADLVVLDRNLFAIDPNEISEARVLLTLLGGKPVYGNWNDLGD